MKPVKKTPVKKVEEKVKVIMLKESDFSWAVFFDEDYDYVSGIFSSKELAIDFAKKDYDGRDNFQIMPILNKETLFYEKIGFVLKKGSGKMFG